MYKHFYGKNKKVFAFKDCNLKTIQSKKKDLVHNKMYSCFYLVYCKILELLITFGYNENCISAFLII